MSVPAINSYSSTPTAADAETSSRLPTKMLNQNDFLTLLVKQMTSQDPMNPKSDMDFAGQMAQFTALEQSRGMLGQQQLLQANAMLGRTVEWQTDSSTKGVGVVEAVLIQPGGVPPLVVVNGLPYDLSQILSITPTPLNPQP